MEMTHIIVELIPAQAHTHAVKIDVDAANADRIVKDHIEYFSFIFQHKDIQAALAHLTVEQRWQATIANSRRDLSRLNLVRPYDRYSGKFVNIREQLSDTLDGDTLRLQYPTASFLPIKLRSDRPLILLDVDGVINIKGNYTETDTQTCIVDGYNIKYSPWIISQINRWHEVADIRWTTSWGYKAQYYLAPALGLENWCPLAPEKKFPAEVPEDLLGRPIVMIDDELAGFMHNAAQHLKSHSKGPLLLVNTEASREKEFYGLSKAQVAEIDEFLSRY